VNVKSILFMKAMQSSEMAFSIYVLLLEYIKWSNQINSRDRKI
jgi:hypothetical protein